MTEEPVLLRIVVSREELRWAFTNWLREAKHGDFKPLVTTPEEYGKIAADHLMRLVKAGRS